MKVMQINCVFAKGSTGKITQDLHKGLLDSDIDSIVCYGRGEKFNDTRIIKTCGEFYSKINQFFVRLSGIVYGGCFFSTNRLIREIKKQKPDIVHIQCINGYFVNIYKLISWLKRSNIKTVLTLHAEFMHTANCGISFDCEKWKTGCGNCPNLKEVPTFIFDKTAKSWKKMKKAFDGFENLSITSVSPWLMERAKQSPFLGKFNHYVVMNGLNTEIFYKRENNVLKEKFNILDKKVIFHATPCFTNTPTDLKGGYHLIEMAKKFPNYIFVVAGENKVEEKLPENIITLGRVSDQKTLAQYYSDADLTLIVSSRETFSMVTAESLCCGTPVVGFKAGGPESIAISEYSKFVEYGNYELLGQAIQEKIGTDVDYKLCQQKYSKETMTKNFLKVYQKGKGEI